MAHHDPNAPESGEFTPRFRAIASTGIVLAVFGFSVALTTLYRYPFEAEFRVKTIIGLLAGTVFLVSGRLLRVYGGLALVALLLVLDATIWAYAEFWQRFWDWWK